MNKFTYAFKQTLNSWNNLNSSLKNEILSSLPEKKFQEFYFLSSKICELEALTFLTQENKEHLKKLNLEFSEFILSFRGFNKIEWRLFASLYCCFIEWCEEVEYFDLPNEDQINIWPENPLLSRDIFNSKE